MHSVLVGIAELWFTQSVIPNIISILRTDTHIYTIVFFGKPLKKNYSDEIGLVMKRRYTLQMADLSGTERFMDEPKRLNGCRSLQNLDERKRVEMVIFENFLWDNTFWSLFWSKFLFNLFGVLKFCFSLFFFKFLYDDFDVVIVIKQIKYIEFGGCIQQAQKRNKINQLRNLTSI